MRNVRVQLLVHLLLLRLEGLQVGIKIAEKNARQIPNAANLFFKFCAKLLGFSDEFIHLLVDLFFEFFCPSNLDVCSVDQEIRVLVLQ